MRIPKIRLRDFSSSADLFLHKLEHIVGSCHTVIGLEAHLYNWQRTELMIERERILHCFEHQEEVSSHVQSLKVTIDYALIDLIFTFNWITKLLVLSFTNLEFQVELIR